MWGGGGGDADLVLESIQKAAWKLNWLLVHLDDWRRMLGSNIFGQHGSDLRKSLARMTQILCGKEIKDFHSLDALLACQLIPLDKSPGICPIGIGEVLRRIIGKTVMYTTRRCHRLSWLNATMCRSRSWCRGCYTQYGRFIWWKWFLSSNSSS